MGSLEKQASSRSCCLLFVPPNRRRAMERELWLALYKLAWACDPAPYWELVKYREFEIVSVYLWAVLHERAVCWACHPINWPKALWPGKLPSQATMSRRLRTTEVQQLLIR